MSAVDDYRKSTEFADRFDPMEALAKADAAIAELKAENEHYREWLGASSVDARVVELEEKLKWAMGLNACIEHERAEQAEAELAAASAKLASVPALESQLKQARALLATLTERSTP